MEINDTRSASQFLSENKAWQSEVGSWEIDLLFCSRMLDIYGLKADSSELKAEQVELKKMVGDVIEIRLMHLKGGLKKNEVTLSKAAADGLLVKDRELPYRQKDDENEMNEAREAVHGLQQRLYSFIEQLKSL